jgi:hypothetical protein
MSTKHMHGRLRALEKRVGPKITACPTCGGPVPGHNSMMILDDNDQPKYGRCAGCCLALTPAGTPMCALPLTPTNPESWMTAIKGIDWEDL